MNVILAGGVERLHEAPEEMEDNPDNGWIALQEAAVSAKDIVIGITAEWNYTFCIGRIKAMPGKWNYYRMYCKQPDSPVAKEAGFPVEVITGPEFITGSTRMKCGTAQKMVFDIISTTTVVQLGRVEDNRMVNVLLINDKITDRAVKMLMEKAAIADYDRAKAILLQQGSVKKAMDHLAGNK